MQLQLKQEFKNFPEFDDIEINYNYNFASGGTIQFPKV